MFKTPATRRIRHVALLLSLPFAPLGTNGATSLGELPAQPAQPLALPTASQDVALDVQLDHLLYLKGEPQEAFQLVQALYLRHRDRPHVVNRYAGLLMLGPTVGAPSDSAEHAVSLALQNYETDTAEAALVLGLAMVTGATDRPDPQKGLAYLHASATAGNHRSAELLAQLYLDGHVIPEDLTAAEPWARQAAAQGLTMPAFILGRRYELGDTHTTADPTKAAALYQLAALHGSSRALQELERLHQQGQPDAKRAHLIVQLQSAALGYDYQTRVIKRAIKEATTDFPDDPEIQYAHALLIAAGKYSRDQKLGFRLVSAAADSGYAPARSLRARFRIDGIGTPKDPAAGIAELQELTATDCPQALCDLGYFHYWGNQRAHGLEKDPRKAFTLNLPAALAGELPAQLNVATCFEFGIGTDIDYAFAAAYYRPAALAGIDRAVEKYLKLLDHVEME